MTRPYNIAFKLNDKLQLELPKEELIMRKLFSLIFTAVLLLTAGCTKNEDNTAQLQALQAENEALRDQVSALQQRIADLEAGFIADWSLTGTPLVQGSGAEVTLTVTPTRYQEGQLVSFRVALEGQTVAELYCDWDGTAYVGSLELDAADGYSYSLLMTDPNGAQEYRELNSPANPVDPTLVYMDSSLNTACFLTIGAWRIADGQLIVDSGSVDIQLPAMTDSTCTNISLVLLLDGQELSRKSVMVPQSDDRTLSIPLSAAAFDIPEITEGNQLDLWLEVVLSDGQVLTHSGSSWFCFEGELVQAVG